MNKEKQYLDVVRTEALKRIQEEDFERQVERMKTVLRNKRGFWNRLFPWQITITKRYEV